MRNGKKIGIQIFIVILLFNLVIFESNNLKNNFSNIKYEQFLPNFKKTIQTKAIDNLNCDIIGEWDINYGPPNDIFITNGYAYLSCGKGGLQIFNVNNPSEPVFVGCFEGDFNALALSIKDNFAYVLTNYMILILDVSNPAAITKVSQLGHYYSVGESIVISGNYAYITLTYDLLIVDISNPYDPEEVCVYNGIGERPSRIRVLGNYAFLCYLSDGLEVLNITDPSNPQFISHFSPETRIYDILIDGNHAFLAGIDQGLYVVNITDLYSPSIITKFSHYYINLPVSLSLKDEILYLGDSIELILINVSNYITPQFVNYISLKRMCDEIFLSGSIVYICGHFLGMQIIDISNPNQLISLSHTPFGGQVKGFWLKDNFAILINDGYGLEIINIANPSSPIEISLSEPIYNTNEIIGKGDFIYIARSRDILVIDISTITNPIIVQTIPGLAFYTDLFIQDNYLFATSADNGLFIWNITLPSSLNLISNLHIPTSNDNVDGLFVKGNYAFVACLDSGIRIIDISNITNPVIVTSFGSSSYYGFSDLIVKDTLAYVLHRFDGLLIYDISNLDSINKVKTISIPDFSENFFIQGDWIYVSSRDTGLTIYNVYNLSTIIKKVGYYYEFHYSRTVQAINHTIYLADDIGGFKILQLNMTDNDFDFLPDYIETSIYHSNPEDNDTDDDSLLDGVEAFLGCDPLDPLDPYDSSKNTFIISNNIFTPFVFLGMLTLYFVCAIAQKCKRCKRERT